MQKLTKKQLFLYSLLISGCTYLAVRVLWSLSGLLRGDSFALVGLYVLFVMVAAFTGYITLRRKTAAVAAGSTAMLLLGLYNLIASATSSLWVGVVLVVLGIFVGAGLFYGWYSFLAVAKRRWLAVSVATTVSLIVGVALSLAATFVLRMSFAS